MHEQFTHICLHEAAAAAKYGATEPSSMQAHMSSSAMPPLPTTATLVACASCAPSRDTLSVSRIVSTRAFMAASWHCRSASASLLLWPGAAVLVVKTLGGSCLGRAPAQTQSLSYGSRWPLASRTACVSGQGVLGHARQVHMEVFRNAQRSQCQCIRHRHLWLR